MEPEQRLNQMCVWHTVAFFGSARIVATARARAELEALEASSAAERSIELARRRLELSRYYDEARILARMLTTWSLSLPEYEQLVVCSGGGGGIMEAANRGASEAGGRTVALNIRLPFEQAANPYVQEELTFDFHYFFMRKFWFLYRAKAAVIFPGGFGTLDELLELLTLMQTGRMEKRIPIVIYGREYWERVINLAAMAEAGTISEADLDLFLHADTPEEAFAAIRDAFTYLAVPDSANSR